MSRERPSIFIVAFGIAGITLSATGTPYGAVKLE